MRTRTAGVIAAAVIAAVVGVSAYGIALSDETQRVTVARVIDGDTIVLADDTRVRLIGIDAPEKSPAECFNQQATNALWDMLANRTITTTRDETQQDQDRYARQLRYVTAGDVDVQRELIEQGYAREATFDGHYERQTEYQQAQQRAQASGAGMWNQENCP